MRYILASGSPRRKELLEQIDLEFKVITSNADECIDLSNPEEMVIELSKRKAEAVFHEIEAGRLNHIDFVETIQKNQEMYAVIGADTIVFHHNKVFGKPSTSANAYDMLKELSGQVHQVYTGVTIQYSDGTRYSFHEKTDVEVYAMSHEEITNYIETGDCMDKAGAYGIQGVFGKYIKGICGDYNNVVGLPVARLYHELKQR